MTAATIMAEHPTGKRRGVGRAREELSARLAVRRAERITRVAATAPVQLMLTRLFLAFVVTLIVASLIGALIAYAIGGPR